MNKLLKTLLLGGSATALAAGAAMAQGSALEIEEIQSSVSRLDLKGFEAPTPVTVVGIEQLNRDARVQLGDQIRDLPQVRGGGSLSAGSVSGNLVQINAGTDSVQIRGMGAQRNLVLFDRQRVVSDTIQENVVNLSLIPSGLTQRVDVVTGGASAAWGSDAVTGVINIVINKTFEGFKGSVSYSDSTTVPKPVYKLSMAWGTSFLGGKGHTVVGWDYTRDDRGVFDGEVARAVGARGRAFVYNSAYCNTVSFPTGATTGGTCSSLSGQPLLVYRYGVGSATTVTGGLTASNTAGTAGSGLTANSLKGTMFAGPDATPTQFNYGTIYNTSSCYNGCTNDQFGTGGWGSINPYHSSVLFNYTSFQILPDLKASIQLNYSRLSLRGAGATISGTNRTIFADNPFLPDSIAQAFVCNGTASASCVTTLSNGYNPYTKTNTGTLAVTQARPTQSLVASFEFMGNRPNPSPTATDSVGSIKYDWNERCNGGVQNCGYYHKQLMRGVFTLEGVIGDSWGWNSYIQWGQARVKENIANTINVRFNNALDAVRVTSGNVGTSGLAIGSIQCRALLNNSLAAALPTAQFTTAAAAALGVTALGELAGCSPFNPFGEGEMTNATRNYINPGLNPAKNPGQTETVLARSTQVAGAFSMNGVLPWQLPAGEIGVALGAEWRMERSGQYNIDPRAQIGAYSSGNFGRPYEGHLHAEEGFLEMAFPILKDDIVQNLSIDLAGRMTNYSFSGLAETWKIGLQSQINDDVRFRMTWSADLRAPNIYDLYLPAGSTQSGNTCASFVTGPTGSNGGAPNQCFSLTGGNPNLKPEMAKTIAAGLVFTPTFIEGLTASVDWYQIHLSGAIVTPGQTEPLDRCRAGELLYCPLLVFANGLPYPAGTTSQVNYVNRAPVNAGALNTAGFDFGVAYGFDLFTGQMDVSLNGNYVYDFSRTLNGITFQGAGGGAQSYYSGGAKFEGSLDLNYREGAWSFGTVFRMTGEYLMDLGNQGYAAVGTQGVTYTGTSSNYVAAVGAGQRDLITGAETNYVAAVVRTDLRAQYRWSNNITLFAAVDNVQNLPTAGGALRRTWRGGIRWNY
jgi:outer membrane receptor protein involved in Fe transport